MCFVNNISKSRITSLVLFLSLALLISLLLITSWEGLIIPFALRRRSLLQRLVQTTPIITLSFPVSQCSLLFPAFPGFKDDSRLIQVGSRSLWDFPSSNSRSSFCSQLLHTGATWLTALFVLDAFLSYRCYTKKTWEQEFQSPSLLRCRESNKIKKTLARYFGQKGKRRCHLTS